MSQDKSNHNLNILGSQKSVVQSIVDSSTSHNSKNVQQFIEAVSKLAPLLGLSAKDEQRLIGALDSIRLHSADTSGNRDAIRSLVGVVADIAKGATASAAGAGIAAMASDLLTKLG